MEPRDANRLGSKKYFEDHGVYLNPFQSGTTEFNEFERGWMQSLKRDDAQLVNSGDKVSTGYMTQEKPKDIPTAEEVFAERYSRMTGR